MKIFLNFLFCLGVLPIVSANSECLSQSWVGTYSINKGIGYLPSTLKIQNNPKDNSLLFNLESYWSPKPLDDGSSTTQAIYMGSFKTNSCIARYQSLEDECTLTFRLNVNKIEITTSGNCYNIGHNANPDGVYIKHE
jgi:hypothetical protein